MLLDSPCRCLLFLPAKCPMRCCLQIPSPLLPVAGQVALGSGPLTRRSAAAGLQQSTLAPAAEVGAAGSVLEGAVVRVLTRGEQYFLRLVSRAFMDPAKGRVRLQVQASCSLRYAMLMPC